MTADTGYYDLIVKDSLTGIDTLHNAFRVKLSPSNYPKLTSISPASGNQGTTVYATIYGSNTALNSSSTTASVGGITCTIDSFNSNTQISVHFSIPASFKTGTYTVNTYDPTDGTLSLDSFVVDTTIIPRYRVKGTVKTSTGAQLTNSWIYLITYNSTDSTVAALDSMKTDSSNGNYGFTLATNTTFYIYAMPNASSFPHEIPTYYDSADFVLNGTSVTLVSGTITNADFHTLSGTNPGGTGFIGGKVNFCTACKKGGSVANLKILLTDMSGKVQAVTYTDANGNFSFKNIALQQYKFMVDMPKVNNNAAPSVSLTSTTPSQSKLIFTLYPNSLDLDNASVTTGISETENVATGVSVYPNPFNTVLNINYTLNTSSEVSVKMLDMTGREVYSIGGGIQNIGTHSISLNEFSALPSGMYLLQLNAGGKMTHQKITKY